MQGADSLRGPTAAALERMADAVSLRAPKAPAESAPGPSASSAPTPSARSFFGWPR